MITWQEVVDASAISGTPVGYSAAITSHNPNENYSATNRVTNDWFAGQFVTLGTTEDSPIFLAEDFADATFDENGGTYLYEWDTQHSFSNGSRKTTLKTFTVVQPNDAPNIVGDTGTSSREEYDSNWSRQTVNLFTYSLTTLSNQAGTITSLTNTFEFVPTTSEQNNQTITTFSQIAANRTTSGFIFTSTVATHSVDVYETVFVTGQTFLQRYSSFSNDIPAISTNNSIELIPSIFEPASFVEIDGYAETQNFTIKSVSQLFTDSAWTTTTAGASVTNETNPQTVVGGSKIATRNALRIIQNTEQQNAEQVFATMSQNGILGTTKEANIGDSTVAAAFGSTSSIGLTSTGYATGGETVIGQVSITQTQSGEFFLDTTNGFATQRAAEVIAVHDVTIGVRANSSQAAGGGIESIGAGQRFSFYTSSVVLPVSTTTQKEGSSFTFFLDSYTAKDSDGETTQSVFSTTGQSQQQWMTIAPTHSAANSASVLGGAIAGNAIVGNGNYRTFAAGGEGNTAVTEPLEVTWQAGAATTAWLPDFRVETVGATSPVVAISRHSFTQVIDD